MLSRRQFLAGAGGLAAGAGLWLHTGRGPSCGSALAAPAEPGAGRTVAVRLVAAERPSTLPCFAGVRLPMWTFSETTWLPEIRLGPGDRLDAVLDNRLPRAGEHTSVHWHGIRLPNDQDGVPFLVQPPVPPGESFRYSFVPPDTGTFFFHTHCNSAEQLGRGLAGILIVEGDATAPYAADETIFLRDWLIDVEAGSFRNFVTKRGASRAGTYGNVRSANGAAEAEVRLPASADCRLRLINGDPTRVMEIALVDAEAAVVAVDGIPVSPFPLSTWLLGPAMRLDLVVRAPAEGGVARIVDQRLGDPVPLVRLVGAGAAPPTKPFDPAPLRAGRIPEPQIDAAERLPFVFAAAGTHGSVVAARDPIDALPLGSLCLSSDDFWTINGSAWPGSDHSRLPPPLARLVRGRPYVFSLKNASQLVHPVHIHGHTFKVLKSDRRALPVHHADTVLLLPEETVDVAFVADNPGRWMFHCHVIEHQETGMMGYLEVV
ncbi:MAG: multicopper oxidase family protein [Bauldia sp.]|nr:multicopper oxidase family protein [Bauldia sp.]